MKKKTVGIGVALVTASVVVTALLVSSFYTAQLLQVWGRVGITLETHSIHCTVTFYQDGEVVYRFHHPGNVTDIGDNQTLYWLFGDPAMTEGTYASNVTYISIGNQGTLNDASTQLPGEWNRTLATIEYQTQSQLNLTCTFYPDNGGPYTADCIGLNYAASGDGNLWAYDILDEVTGIDETFTIDVDFQVSTGHA